jgi:hypothetical protein
VRDKRGIDSNRFVYLGKSAQVTIFIILGIILLITVGIITWLSYSYVDEIPATFELSQEPVVAYIQQCLVDVTEEAVLKAGQQGGYIYTDKLSEEEIELAEVLPFSTEYLLLPKQQLPYWYYQESNGFDRIEIPELEMEYYGDFSIQDQIERYIHERLPACLNNFAALQNAGITVSHTGETFISSQIATNGIQVTANMPITIREASATTEMNEFTVTLNSPLKKVYNLAVEITEHELDTLFLERNTQNLLSIYGQVDNAYLPPMFGGLHFESCAARQFWFYTDVEKDVQNMLAANIPYLKVAGTEFDRIQITNTIEQDKETQELRQAMMDKFIISPSKGNYEGVSASFNYQTTYPMELTFGNNLGYGLLQPQSLEIDLLLANFCMFDYAFLYNLKYPVLITLTDATTNINGNAFVFQFPLQVVIKNNYPRIKLNDALRFEFDIPETSPSQPTWQCDPQQRLSGESTVTVQTAYNKPIEDAVISFQCGPSYVYDFTTNGTVDAVIPFGKTCYMGTTDESGELTTTFPPCIGSGVMTIEHEDYVETSTATADIKQGESFEQTIKVNKVYTMNVDMQKFFTPPPSKTNEEGIGIHTNNEGEIIACNLNMEAKQLQSYESAVITLTKLDVENGIINSAPIIIYEPPTDQTTQSETTQPTTQPTTQQTTIDIAPGRYLVDIILLREEKYLGEMTIEANSQSIVIEGVLNDEIITYPEDDVLIEQTFSGGALFEWQVSAQQLESGSTILFSVFDQDAPTKVEQIASPLQYREVCSELEWSAIKPKIR